MSIILSNVTPLPCFTSSPEPFPGKAGCCYLLVAVESDEAVNRIAYLADGFPHRASAGLSIGDHARVFARALDSFRPWRFPFAGADGLNLSFVRRIDDISSIIVPKSRTSSANCANRDGRAEPCQPIQRLTGAADSSSGWQITSTSVGVPHSTAALIAPSSSSGFSTRQDLRP